MDEDRSTPAAQDIGRLEHSMVGRYKMWAGFSRFGYKHAKGNRIARIIEESGGVPRLTLEVGVGPGGVASAVSRHGTSVVGVDLSPDALKTAKEHCRDVEVFLARASGFALPFRTATFDLAYCSQVMHLFEGDARVRLMYELARVVRPGGRFIFDMKNIASHPLQYATAPAHKKRTAYPSDGELRDVMRGAGFDLMGIWPGLLPRVSSAAVPNVALFRAIAHTRFYVAQRRG